MANDDSRYVGAFFNSYTNTRMKLHRHCVPLEDDRDKIVKVYGYSPEEVDAVFAELDRDLEDAVTRVRETYGSRLDEKLKGREANFVFIGDQLTSEYLSYYNIIRKVCAPYDGIGVFIAGNTGDTSNQSVQYVYGLAVSKAPLVTSILIGTNDIYKSGDVYGKTVSSREEYRQNVDYLVKVMLHNASKVILHTLPPVNEEEAEAAYAHMNWRIENEEIDARNEILRKIAENNGCSLNDMAVQFKAFDRPVNLPGNGVLLTKEAQLYMAEKFLETLLEMI